MFGTSSKQEGSVHPATCQSPYGMACVPHTCCQFHRYCLGSFESLSAKVIGQPWEVRRISCRVTGVKPLNPGLPTPRPRLDRGPGDKKAEAWGHGPAGMSVQGRNAQETTQAAVPLACGAGPPWGVQEDSGWRATSRQRVSLVMCLFSPVFCGGRGYWVSTDGSL